MTLRDALEKNQPRTQFGPACGVARIRNSLTAEEQVAIDEAIVKIRAERDNDCRAGQSGYNAVWLTNALQSEGYKISYMTVQRHIRKSCSCGF